MEKENSNNKAMDEKIITKGQRKIGVRKNLYSAAGMCRYCKYGQKCKDRECKGCPNSYGGSESLCHCMDEVSIMLPQCPYYKD